MACLMQSLKSILLWFTLAGVQNRSEGIPVGFCNNDFSIIPMIVILLRLREFILFQIVGNFCIISKSN